MGSQRKEIFHVWRSKSSDLVHAVMRFLTLYLTRIWIKILHTGTTHTETESEFVKKKSEAKKSAKVTQKHENTSVYTYTINAVLFLLLVVWRYKRQSIKH